MNGMFQENKVVVTTTLLDVLRSFVAHVVLRISQLKCIEGNSDRKAFLEQINQMNFYLRGFYSLFCNQ